MATEEPSRPDFGYWEDDENGVPTFKTRPMTDAEYAAWLAEDPVV